MSRSSASTVGATILMVAALGAAEAGFLPGNAVTAAARGDGLVQLAQAKAPGQLPGGATSLREAHGDWLVACNAALKANICSVSQQQTDTRSGQRVLAIEVGSPSANETRATLVLPFGLQLDKGVVLQVDDTAATTALAFKTCLPAGCIVETTLSRQVLAAWRKGTILKLKAAAADTGNEVALTISLKGLGQALDRSSTLAK